MATHPAVEVQRYCSQSISNLESFVYIFPHPCPLSSYRDSAPREEVSLSTKLLKGWPTLMVKEELSGAGREGGSLMEGMLRCPAVHQLALYPGPPEV
jgi:hypothetical protein